MHIYSSKNVTTGKIIVICFVSALWCFILIACAHTDGPYKGKVVELETGKPIEGAVVAASWSIEEVPHAQKVCDAEETVTDKNGEFVLPEGSCVSHPFAKIFGPYVIVFKPGYLGYPPLGYNQEQRKTYMPNFTGNEFKDKKQYNIIEFGRPKTLKERKLTLSDASSPLIHDETLKKLPILLRITNEESRSLGLGERPIK